MMIPSEFTVGFLLIKISDVQRFENTCFGLAHTRLRDVTWLWQIFSLLTQTGINQDHKMNHKQTENSQNIFNIKIIQWKKGETQNHFKISNQMQRQTKKLRIKPGQDEIHSVFCSQYGTIWIISIFLSLYYFIYIWEPNEYYISRFMYLQIVSIMREKNRMWHSASPESQTRSHNRLKLMTLKYKMWLKCMIAHYTLYAGGSRICTLYALSESTLWLSFQTNTSKAHSL